MTKIRYKKHKFGRESLEIIYAANNIIEEYQGLGYDLTLRQLYYQFVSRDLLANNEKNYKKLGNIISDGRLAGLVSWTAIEDRTRMLRGNSHFLSPADVIRAAKASYKIDMWENQPERVEVWIEKDALLNAVERVCRRLDVNYFACRGYTSQSEEWRAARRFQRYDNMGQRVTILYLGDHDPSGIDMTRDHEDRMTMFGVDVNVRRLALNYDQIEQYSPPPNPTKLTDSRAGNYLLQYGHTCWELDALSPTTIGNLIEDAILEHRDEELFEVKEAQYKREQDKLDSLLDGLE